MRMGRKIWLALALAVIVAVSFAAGAVAAKHKAASDPRPKTVTRGLDYFHARQKVDGGFGTMTATAWVILGAVASGERVGSTMWTVDGNNPFGYCLLYTSDAADDLLCVDLGGRRIIKKKNTPNKITQKS